MRMDDRVAARGRRGEACVVRGVRDGHRGCLGRVGVDPSQDVRRRDVPGGDEPIRGRALMQRAAGHAVDVLQIILGDDPEAREVEVRVRGLQRIVGPLDQVEALRQRAIALRELQAIADARSPVLRIDAEHVRPLHRASVLQSRQRVDERREAPLVERAD